MDIGELIAEINKYKSELERVLSRFIRGSETYNIHPSDDAAYRRKIIEVCDLLHDTLENNSYSVRISNLYEAGLQNYLCSPSYKSIEHIVGELGAVITRLERNPQIVHQRDNSDREKEAPRKCVFIGHGHSAVWREIKDFLVDRLHLEYIEFNRDPSAGKSYKERILEMLNASGFALIVMTAEDETKDGKLRARENVVHEAGPFQGRLGFERAIILREEACEQFSNIHGLVQIPFPHGNPGAAFEEITRTLEREGIIPGA